MWKKLGGKKLFLMFSHSSWERLVCLQISYIYIRKSKYSPKSNWGRFWQLQFDLITSTLLVYLQKSPKIIFEKLFFGPKLFSLLWNSNRSTAFHCHLSSRSNAQSIIFTNLSPNGPTGKSLYIFFVVFWSLTHFNQCLWPKMWTGTQND